VLRCFEGSWLVASTDDDWGPLTAVGTVACGLAAAEKTQESTAHPWCHHEQGAETALVWKGHKEEGTRSWAIAERVCWRLGLFPLRFAGVIHQRPNPQLTLETRLFRRGKTE